MKRYILAIFLSLISLTAANATAKFAVCVTACTWDSSSTAMWSLSSGGATGAAVPSSADTVTFDGATCVGGVTCTITLNFGGTITIQSLTTGACTASTTGCIFDNSVNNNNITVTATGSAFNWSGAGTRNMKLGSATYTMSATGSGATWAWSNISNATISAASATIAWTGSASNVRTITGPGTGGITYGTLTLSANSGAGYYALTGINTFGTFNVTAPIFVRLLSGSAVQTVTNAINWVGTGANPIGMSSDATGNQGTFTLTNGGTLAYASLRDIIFTGGTVTANNSLNVGNNSGVTINGPSAGGGCILGGWLLWRDMPEHLNDNFPAWLEKSV